MPGPAGRAVHHDLARRRHEVVVRILGVDARLDRVTADREILLLEGQLLARRDADHRLHDVDAGDHLGDRVLHLHAGVHLEEVEIVVLVDEELAGAGADVVHRLGRRDRRRAHLGAQLGRDAIAGRLLDHLLVTALDRALALEEMHAVAVRVGEDLDLDVARLLDELLDVERVVAEAALAPPSARGRPSGISSLSVRTSRMPLPPPPALALIITGRPIFAGEAAGSVRR